MDCSMPGLPVHHQLPEFTQTHSISWWCHPTISSSVVPFSSCPQSFPALGSFPMSQLFSSGGQSIGASASALVLLMNIQDLFSLGLTGWSPCCLKYSQESSPTAQFESINSLVLSLLYGPTLSSIYYYWKNFSFDYADLDQWLRSTGVAVRRYPTSKGREAPASKMVDAGSAAVQCWSDFEEIPPPHPRAKKKPQQDSRRR